MAYQTLLARTPAWRNTVDGADRVLFTLDNMTLELMAPHGDGETADRIREVIAQQGEGLASSGAAVAFFSGQFAHAGVEEPGALRGGCIA